MPETETPSALPGLVDLQVNGFAGVDFNDPSLQTGDVTNVCRRLAREGVVAFLPTLVTNDFRQIESLARTILAVDDSGNDSADDSSGARILGLHLEGPFISPHDGARGAHPLEWVRRPDFDQLRRLHDRLDGRIRLLTFSPEWEDAARFVKSVCQLGIRVAIGHTLATHEQIIEAVDAGASLSTHLGNAIPATLPRHPNPIWSQLSDDRLWVSLIGDGFHLPPEVFKTILKIKGHRAFLVSDSTQFAGMKAGRYQTLIGGDVVLTESGRLSMASDDRLLAGSAMSLRRMIDALVSTGRLSFSDAWELGSVRPWQYLGETDTLPTLRFCRSNDEM